MNDAAALANIDGESEPFDAITDVIRHGATVHRSGGPWTPAVHALLAHLEAVGFDAAPAVLGYDPIGREILTWIEGTVVPDPASAAWSLPALQEVGALIRRMHDASAGFVLPSGVHWAHEAESDIVGEPVICHNDLAPKNVVLRYGHPVAIIDWDLASPSPRIWDLAHALWQFVPLGTSSLPLESCIARCRALLHGYGDRWQVHAHEIAEIVALRMQRTADGIAILAADGVPPFVHLRDRGVICEIRGQRDWVMHHAAILNRGILAPDDR